MTRRDLKKDFAAVVMGSAEGYDTAESLVTAAAKRGTWVVLKNCHLCTKNCHLCTAQNIAQIKELLSTHLVYLLN
jgi:hypothetical protein